MRNDPYDPKNVRVEDQRPSTWDKIRDALFEALRNAAPKGYGDFADNPNLPKSPAEDQNDRRLFENKVYLEDLKDTGGPRARYSPLGVIDAQGPDGYWTEYDLNKSGKPYERPGTTQYDDYLTRKR